MKRKRMGTAVRKARGSGLLVASPFGDLGGDFTSGCFLIDHGVMHLCALFPVSVMLHNKFVQSRVYPQVPTWPQHPVSAAGPRRMMCLVVSRLSSQIQEPKGIRCVHLDTNPCVSLHKVTPVPTAQPLGGNVRLASPVLQDSGKRCIWGCQMLQELTPVFLVLPAPAPPGYVSAVCQERRRLTARWQNRIQYRRRREARLEPRARKCPEGQE